MSTSKSHSRRKTSSAKNSLTPTIIRDKKSSDLTRDGIFDLIDCINITISDTNNSKQKNHPKSKKTCKKKYEILENDDTLTVMSGNHHLRSPKEHSCVSFIMREFNQYDWKINERMGTGKSYIIPDMRLTLDDCVIYVEVDENQHRTYEKSKENNRIVKMTNNVYGKIIHIIRFNPDDYLAGDNYIPSCWKNNRIIDKNQWDLRLERLKNVIENCIVGNHSQSVNIIYLFYDKSESVGKQKLNEDKISEDNTEMLLSIFEDKIKQFKMFTGDYLTLKKDYYISFINLNKRSFKKGGRLKEIRNEGNYCVLEILTSNKKTFNLRTDKNIIFYKEKTATEIRNESAKKWKENFKKNDPIGYEKWLLERRPKVPARINKLRKKLVHHVLMIMMMTLN